MRILFAEDDPVLSDGITKALRQSGYAVDWVKAGDDADYALSTIDYDMVILDLGLPKMDGLEVLKNLRGRKNRVPVLVLTARASVSDRVLGLDHGADDYLTKPFNLPELEARIRALIRRRHFDTHSDLEVGNIRFDTIGKRVYINDQLIELSAREISVLELLLIYTGRVVSKEQFVDHLYGWEEEVSENAIEVCIHRIRKKLEPFGVKFRTVRGLGYLVEGTA
jgi:two-component system, OmpR family, response regulator